MTVNSIPADFINVQEDVHQFMGKLDEEGISYNYQEYPYYVTDVDLNNCLKPLQMLTRKQLFNFAVPVIVGLFHSYFAVKSGWWFFRTEFAIPMLIMMCIYVVLYILFAILAIRYYRSVVSRSF